MPRFKFRSMDKRGQACEGTASASNLAALTEMLRQQNQFLISATQVAEKADGAPKPAAAAPVPRAKKEGRRRRVSDADVAVFNNQFTLMIRSAVPILDALSTLAAQQGNPVMRETLQGVADAVKGGSNLRDAFGRYPQAFDDVYLSLIEAGEASGTLPRMLERLGAYIEFKVAVRGKIRSAMVYPSVVMGAAFLVVMGLILFVLPTFAEVFEQFDAPLPPITQFLLALSTSMRGHWLLWAVTAAAMGLGVRVWVMAERNQLAIHALMLSFPVVGKATTCIVLSRVTRILGELLGAGVPILKSLELSEAAAGNAIIAGVLRRMRGQVEGGQPLWPSLAASEYIPDMVSHVVAGAEKSGKLPEALAYVADYYQREVDAALRDLFAAIEPLFVVFLGLSIGGIAVSMLIPIFQLGGVVQ